MARAKADENLAFWTLFRHIKQNEIAMTAPVKMSYSSAENGDRRQQSMAFLYGHRGLGEVGPSGSVRVVDVPPQTVVSTGMRGQRTRKKVEAAYQRLKDWIDSKSQQYQVAGNMRVMGYNSPFVPSNRQYFEVQIPITAAQAAADRESGDFALSDYVWKHRVLLAFAPSRAADSFKRLRHSWDARRAEVAERDLVLVEVFENGESWIGRTRLPGSTSANLRQQFDVKVGRTTFILIGKDGTVKRRQPDAELTELFAVIDAMPMRRAEMRMSGRS
jgi:hypothetical protein